LYAGDLPVTLRDDKIALIENRQTSLKLWWEVDFTATIKLLVLLE